MKITRRYKVKHRRAREKKTDFRTRLKLIKSGKPRVVIRKSLSHTSIQFIKFNPKGDETVASSHTSELKKFGWKFSENIPSAYLAGLLAGKRAMKKGIKESILDIGLQRSTKGSRIYSALKGVIDAGIAVNHDPKIFPSEDRIRGKHIQGFDVNVFEDVKKKLLEMQ